MVKSFPSLSVADIAKYPVWRFTNNDEVDELKVESVEQRPVDDLGGIIVGAQVSLADGATHWALLQNISLEGQVVNEHFLALTLRHRRRWFPLARYHDVQVDEYGNAALARFLQKPIKSIFPIQYDLRSILGMNYMGLMGAVDAEPRRRLSEQEIISYALGID